MKKKIILLIIFVFVSACGFKTLDYDKPIPIKIENIKYSGNKYLNFILKNKFQVFKKKNPSNTNYNLSVTSSVDKSIYEKNIKNEITKFQLDFKVKITLTDQSDNIVKTFLINKTNNFAVGDYQAETKTREKKYIKLYSNIIGDEIVKRIVLETNDL